MANVIVLQEGALNDNELYIADPGKCFGRRDYLFKVIYWTFANAWCNNKHVFYAKTLEAALKRYQRICGKLDEDTIDTVYCCGYNI